MKEYQTSVEIKKRDLSKEDGSYCNFCGQTKRIVFEAQHGDQVYLCEPCVDELAKLPKG